MKHVSFRTIASCIAKIAHDTTILNRQPVQKPPATLLANLASYFPKLSRDTPVSLRKPLHKDPAISLTNLPSYFPKLHMTPQCH